jgi:hypothetical protein
MKRGRLECWKNNGMKQDWLIKLLKLPNAHEYETEAHIRKEERERERYETYICLRK